MELIKSTDALKDLYNDASGPFSYIQKRSCYPEERRTILRGIELDPRDAATVTDRTMTKFRAIIGRRRAKYILSNPGFSVDSYYSML